MWYGTIWFYIIFYYLFSKKLLFFSKLIHLDPLFSYCWPPNLLLLPNYKVLFVYLFPFPFVALQTRCPDSWEVHQKGMYSLGSGLVHLNLLLTWILWILYCFMPMVNLWFSVSVQARSESPRFVRGGLHYPTVAPSVWGGEGCVCTKIPEELHRYLQ